MQGGDPTGTGRGGESIYGYVLFDFLLIVIVLKICSSFYHVALLLPSHG